MKVSGPPAFLKIKNNFKKSAQIRQIPLLGFWGEGKKAEIAMQTKGGGREKNERG